MILQHSLFATAEQQLFVILQYRGHRCTHVWSHKHAVPGKYHRRSCTEGIYITPKLAELGNNLRQLETSESQVSAYKTLTSPHQGVWSICHPKGQLPFFWIKLSKLWTRWVLFNLLFREWGKTTRVAWLKNLRLNQYPAGLGYRELVDSSFSHMRIIKSSSVLLQDAAMKNPNRVSFST